MDEATQGNIAVYPRVCGGICGIYEAGPCVEGLSPRVRGNLGFLFFSDLMAGSIPACAGESLVNVYYGVMRRVYPRVCGGIIFLSLILFAAEGLSPRVRGNRSF